MLLTDKNGKHIPIINTLSKAKIVLSKDSIKHVLSDVTSSTKEDSSIGELRRDVYHYELVPVLRELIQNGVLIEEHEDKHKKDRRVYRLFCPVEFDDGSFFVVKLTIKKQKNNYLLDDDSFTDLRIYDVQRIKKEPVQRPQSSGEPGSHEGSPTSLSGLSIADILKDVKDNNGIPYIGEDGKLNVNFVENTNTFNQSAWHGTPHNFEAFDLGAIGTGEGNQVHG
ncbi:MAG: hypothetical protein IJ320_02420 [Phascolarctobacterium sp.]|nr:hypothetical protein [Phascolarctobacterium sp.]